MFCPKCGAQLPDAAKFCNKCGADLRMLSEVQPRRESSYQYADHGYSEPAAAKKPRAARKKKKMSNLTAGILAVVLVVGIFVAVLVPSTINYNKKSKLKTANSNAKTAAVSVMEVFEDAEINGLEPYDIMYDESAENKHFIEPGKTYDASDPDSISDAGAKAVAMVLAENGGEAGYFVLIDTFVDDKERFVIQWKEEKDSDIIGQYSFEQQESDDDLHYFYYSSIDSDFVTWDSYKEKHPRWGKYYKN